MLVRARVPICASVDMVSSLQLLRSGKFPRHWNWYAVVKGNVRSEVGDCSQNALVSFALSPQLFCHSFVI